MGDTPQLKDYYEKNARNLISTWGEVVTHASCLWAWIDK